MVFVEHLKLKSDAPELIKRQITRLETQFDVKVKHFHSDGGSEFVNSELHSFFNDKGIRATYTMTSTPQHNPVAERTIRTIFEMANSMRLHANLPKKYWKESVDCAAYIRARSITRGTQSHHPNITPFEIAMKTKPNVTNLKTFGCDCWVYVRDDQRGALDPKAWPAIFLGYSETQHGFIVENALNNRRTVERHVVFNENSFKHAHKAKQQCELSDSDIEIHYELLQQHEEGKAQTAQPEGAAQSVDEEHYGNNDHEVTTTPLDIFFPSPPKTIFHHRTFNNQQQHLDADFSFKHQHFGTNSSTTSICTDRHDHQHARTIETALKHTGTEWQTDSSSTVCTRRGKSTTAQRRCTSSPNRKRTTRRSEATTHRNGLRR
jgi:uncharacterized protein (DUF2164 family)